MATLIQLKDGVAVNKFPIGKPSLRIGRHPDNDIYIDDKVVSVEHAVIEVVEDPDQKRTKEYYIKDLGSTNGTYVNGKKITRKKLDNNDLMRIGLITFKLIDEDELEPDETLKIRKSWIPGVYYTKE
jgi:pSer/pThr/pTyr-binding forkhead associated (FHA) protein